MESLNINELNIYNGLQTLSINKNDISYVDKYCLEKLEKTGDNTNGVLLIVDHNIGDLSSSENVLLTKILQAVDLSIKKVCVVHKPNFNISLLWHYINFHKCLIFGVHPKEIGLYIEVQHYDPCTLNDKVFLFSDSVTVLLSQPEKKKTLWKALQLMFK